MKKHIKDSSDIQIYTRYDKFNNLVCLVSKFDINQIDINLNIDIRIIIGDKYDTYMKATYLSLIHISLSAYQNPPLATVDINAYELGYSAAKLLINNLEGKEHAKRHYIVDTEFIERESFI